MQLNIVQVDHYVLLNINWVITQILQFSNHCVHPSSYAKACFIRRISVESNWSNLIQKCLTRGKFALKAEAKTIS